MEKVINYGGKKLYYNLSGSGKAVVLLHGFGEDGSIWKNQVPFLENKFQLIVPHLPGSGPSDLIEDMSIEGMAESVKSILDEENISNCIMIGHSMGGYITLAFAEKYGYLLKGYGLFHSTAYADSEEKRNVRRKGIEFINKHGALEFLKTSITNLYSPDTKQNNPLLIDEHLQAVSYFSKEALTAYYEAMIKRRDRTHVLQQNKIPVLFVLGKYDMAVPMEDTLKQSHLPDLAYIHILNRSGHMGMCEEPDESNKLLLEFLLRTV